MSQKFPAALTGAGYSESRHHELRKSRMMMIDGNLSLNNHSVEGGASSRVYLDGYWGFASAPRCDTPTSERLGNQALANARAMSRFGNKAPLAMPEVACQGEYLFSGKSPLSQRDCMNLLSDMEELCKGKYAGLQSRTFILHDEHHSKYLTTSTGSRVLNSIQRAACYIFFTVEDDNGNPVELVETISGKGGLADLELSLATLEPRFDRLYEHIQAKKQAVPARGGVHTIVLAPELAGMLAHEAMGHPCEADLVLGGAVTGELMGQRVASDLVTMVDFANCYAGRELMIPVYADDEGTPAKDAVLIEKGLLKQFMNSRETAVRLGHEPTGNARAYQFGDEPLVRMRNTAILPGNDKLEDMICGVEDGYYLMNTGNGQADSTTEFMFGITLGYEIKNGKLGRAIRDTTVSGTAIKMLQSVDAVSDDMHWTCSGYCGKKQPMVVSMGGPALRGRAHLGGE